MMPAGAIMPIIEVAVKWAPSSAEVCGCADSKEKLVKDFAAASTRLLDLNCFDLVC